MENLILEKTEVLTSLVDDVPQTLMQNLTQKPNHDVLVIILLEKNLNFKNFLKPYELNICGKKMWEWVKMATLPYKHKTTTCTNESDILSLIKPLLEEQKYTAVFYSDTPLLKKSTFDEIMSFASSRDMNVLKLTRGFVFNTEYIKKASSLQATHTEYFDEEDFMTAYDIKQLSFITDIMRGRILDYHMRNGVLIQHPQTVYIDADVVIEAGTQIGANNHLRGRVIVGKNCVIDSNNVIENSIISDGCIIESSYISESRISEYMTVGPFEKIVKQSS
jgi:bifunctional N-acetylglucosamine-1-phosphate-uridyltransferase/glucosamine-1-phosphate-acetyltransferase GlmU-like protein